MNNNQRNQTYTCPMHPEVIRDEPGLCPGCGMALIPSNGGQHGAHVKHVKSDGYDVSEVSHKDHETAMTNSQMAKKMEQDMRRRFWVSFFQFLFFFIRRWVKIY